MLSKQSVKRPLTVFVAVVCVIVLGIIAFGSLKTDLLPSLELPYVVVVTPYPGAPPEKVEKMVTKPLESGLSTIGGLENITSVSNENVSRIILEFSYAVSMDTVMIDISNMLDSVRGRFEDETIGSPTVMRISPDMLPIAVVSVDIQGYDSKEATKLVKENIIPAFERVPGIASVSSLGMVENRIEVRLSQSKIDKINDRLLGKVDRELSDSEAEIKKNQKALEDAKSKLYAGSAQGLGEIEKALAELSAAKSVSELALRELNLLVSAAEDAVSSLKDQIAALEKEIEDQGGVPTAQQSDQLTLLNVQLTAGEAALSLLKGQQSELQAGVNQMTDGQKQLMDAKAKLDKTVKESSDKINSSQIKLDLMLLEFENARDRALESANLDGVITQRMIVAVLTAQNFSMPAGTINEDENTQFTVKVGDLISSVKDLENVPLFDTGIEGIGIIYLSDVADVLLSDSGEDVYAKINGNDGIILQINKQSSYSTNEVSGQLNEVTKNLEAEYQGMRFTYLMDQGIYIDIVIGSVISNLLMGAGLAVLILLIFLKSVKPTLIIALSIPISLLLAIVLMYFSNVNLNVISLAGLALGVGMLVDNSIVAIENIYRLRSLGVPAARAAVEGTQQIAGAIASSTLTTVCVFLPIVFTEGLSKQIFTDMGLTIAYSLIASLGIALYVVPALSATVLKEVGEKQVKWFDRIVSRYTVLLEKVLNKKAVLLVSVAVLFLISAAGAYMMGTAFIPESDMNNMTVSFSSPDEYSRDQTREALGRLAEVIESYEDVEAVGAIQQRSSHSASVYIVLKADRKLSSKEIARNIMNDTQDLGCEISVSTSSLQIGAMMEQGIQLVIEGDDLDTLRKISSEVASLISQVEGTENVSDGSEDFSDEIRISVNKEEAMKYNLTVAQVYQQVASELTEEVDAPSISMNGEDISIKIFKDAVSLLKKDSLAKVKIQYTDKGEQKKVALAEIAELTDAESLPVIRHENLHRTVTVNADVADGYNIGLVSRSIMNAVSDYKMPDGYSLRAAGENEMIDQSLTDLTFMLMLAVLLIFLIMVAQFQSFLSPFIVMFTLPLAFTGGLLALWVFGFDISVISMLGFLVLAGVVVNNGIVFVDYANQLMLEGYEKHEALIETGRTRIRPILMTTLTTVLGLLTMGFGMGEGADMLQPMAVVVIFGLTYATLLTLFVVPVFYDIIRRKPPVSIDIGENEKDALLTEESGT